MPTINQLIKKPRRSLPRINKVKILRPQEIPKYVEEGYFDIGIAVSSPRFALRNGM